MSNPRVSNIRASRSFAKALLAIVSMACALVPAHAERADRSKPSIVEALSLRVDDIKQIGTAKGNVVFTKGTILIRSNELEWRADAQGYEFAQAVGDNTKRAFFRQKREGLDEFIEAEATRIEYDGKADLVRFIGKAVVRRYRGATLADEAEGNLIIYDNGTDAFSVEGAAGGQPGGRVRAVLAPRKTASLPAQGATGPLRSTDRLTEPQGDRK
jgi:lipopolysaccharide export system protein LptA